MSTKTKATKAKAETPAMLNIRELGSLILKHHGIHEGLYDLKIEFQMATGGVGPDKASLLPGIIIGISKVGVELSKNSNETTLDAAIVNPPAKRTSTSK